jgi:hypothetical protein
MKSILIAAMISVFAGCVVAPADEQASPTAKAGVVLTSSTIERSEVNSDVVQIYTPGASEVVLYNSATERASKTPASADMLSVFNRVVSEVAGVGAGSGISCSSRDGAKDCFCPSGCCRDESSCHCC